MLKIVQHVPKDITVTPNAHPVSVSRKERSKLKADFRFVPLKDRFNVPVLKITMEHFVMSALTNITDSRIAKVNLSAKFARFCKKKH